ncbi:MULTISPECIES: DsbA family oxidoreductase [unclassified Candidatus Frackibacter]|uniref:DsbA family oxidoreductase n=1 Tax=unclassified Candidatus Frackibacter TaxID=2648818 RepID=UPI000B7E8BFB|nr:MULTISPECIES: DsbA family protein [unclassified Candidatus Frackibacter]
MGKAIVDRLKQEFDIEEEWYGLEIHPETPLGGEDITKKFDSKSIERLYDRLNQRGKEYGIKFNQSKKLSNTHLALILSEYAKETGCFEAFHHRLFEAYFEDEKDIGDKEVLLQIANEVGLSKDEVKEAWQDSKWEEKLKAITQKSVVHGATGVPTFIINDEYRIVGAQPYEKFEEILKKIKRSD